MAHKVNEFYGPLCRSYQTMANSITLLLLLLLFS